MTKPASFFPDNIPQELIDSVDTGLLLCDKDTKVLQVNKAAVALLSHEGKNIIGESCYSLLFGLEEMCADCAMQDKEGRQCGEKQSLTIKRPDKDIFLKISCASLQDRMLLTLHDVSREIGLLRRTDLERKELQARNLLLERQRRLKSAEQEILEKIINLLPDVLITVDDNFVIQRHNRIASKVLEANEVSTCFSMLGRERPCDGCPAKNGFSSAAGQKKSHAVANRYYTEVFSLSPSGGGGLLVFRDTTRQVELIEKIKENQDVIDRKNRILSYLVDFGTYLHKATDARDVINYFFDKFLPLLGISSAALIVKDIRPGNLWLSEARGLQAKYLDALSKACLSREMQKKEADVISAEFLPWENTTQEVLRGTTGNWLGNLVFPARMNEEDYEVIGLLVETLGAYLENQLLLRQLEEKANKDSLTGLYNRGFIAQAQKEEQAKFEKYNIPYALVLADVDQLKRVNDEYGHEVGDLMIIEAGRALKRAVRETDTLARTGGDEFLLLLTGTTDENARIFVERLKERFLKDLTISVIGAEKIPITVSLGWAGSDKHQPSEMINEADRIMYEAKRDFYKSVERYR